jgi:Na+/melibiose symporter-like transporter
LFWNGTLGLLHS